MRVFPPLPKPFLAVLATLFATTATLHSGLWVFSASRPIAVELGFDNKYVPAMHAQLVQSVVPGSPAELAGMKPGDRFDGPKRLLFMKITVTFQAATTTNGT